METPPLWHVSKTAALHADKALWDKYPELERRYLSMDAFDGDYRKEWMDFYENFGGETLNVGNSGIRVATIDFRNEASQAADKELWETYPELGGRMLSVTSVEDGSYRKIWVDLYIKHGGEVVEIGNSGVRVALP
jgi:hypothetical protein